MDDHPTGHPPALPEDPGIGGAAQPGVPPDGDETHRGGQWGFVPAVGALGDGDLSEVVRAVGVLQIGDDDAVDLAVARIRPRVVKTTLDVLDLDADMVARLLKGVEVLPGVVVGGEHPRGPRRRGLSPRVCGAVRPTPLGRSRRRARPNGPSVLIRGSRRRAEAAVEHERDRQRHAHGQILPPLEHSLHDLLGCESGAAVDVLPGAQELLPGRGAQMLPRLGRRLRHPLVHRLSEFTQVDGHCRILVAQSNS